MSARKPVARKPRKRKHAIVVNPVAWNSEHVRALEESRGGLPAAERALGKLIAAALALPLPGPGEGVHLHALAVRLRDEQRRRLAVRAEAESLVGATT